MCKLGTWVCSYCRYGPRSLRDVSSTLLNLCLEELRRFWRQKGALSGTNPVWLNQKAILKRKREQLQAGHFCAISVNKPLTLILVFWLRASDRKTSSQCLKMTRGCFGFIFLRLSSLLCTVASVDHLTNDGCYCSKSRSIRKAWRYIMHDL